MLDERTTLLNNKPANNDGKYVLYWMQMTKRAEYNHALDFAVREANKRKIPVVVYEGLKYYYPWASDRFHAFIMEGVNEKREAFEKKGIKYIFYLQQNEKSPKNTVAALAKDAAMIVTDDYPCFIIPKHNKTIAEKSKIAVYAVDSNGIIPMSRFEKEEYAAYTIRPKIHRMWDDYLKPFKEETVAVRADKLKVDCPDTLFEDTEIQGLITKCSVDHSVGISSFYKGGTANGRARLKKFIKDILESYDGARNKPEKDGSSRLSSYIHFGNLSVLEIALAAKKSGASQASKDAFLEELIVRRELSFNFTKFNPKYDSLESLPNWVQQTMRDHIDDKRQYLYSLEDLENYRTHDELWNAAQREMVETGEMHNYIRMLWGKNVIGWTKSYEEAFSVLEHLNNKYCLDGRDPNSYAGILWCFGKHDRPWMEREVFGTIRYMTSGSTGKKFDSKKYIAWSQGLSQRQLFE